MDIVWLFQKASMTSYADVASVHLNIDLNRIQINGKAVDVLKKNVCINVCIIKIHVPRAHEVKIQRVIAKRTSQIMKYGQDVIIQKRTDDNIQ